MRDESLAVRLRWRAEDVDRIAKFLRSTSAVDGTRAARLEAAARVLLDIADRMDRDGDRC